jgi:hypothetical protein
MKTMIAAAIGLVVCGCANLAMADDPTGTWKWEIKSPKYTTHFVLKLKREGDKLTGSMTTTKSPKQFAEDNTPEKIENGAYKDGVVSFAIFRKVSIRTTVSLKFSGKLAGNTIKGEWVSDNVPMGSPLFKKPWEAKRAAD